jgi:hypothetical protein
MGVSGLIRGRIADCVGKQGNPPRQIAMKFAWAEMLSSKQQFPVINYFSPITMECPPTSGSTRVLEKPASRIQV